MCGRYGTVEEAAYALAQRLTCLQQLFRCNAVLNVVVFVLLQCYACILMQMLYPKVLYVFVL